jgi:hypothetical protein
MSEAGLQGCLCVYCVGSIWVERMLSKTNACLLYHAFHHIPMATPRRLGGSNPVTFTQSVSTCFRFHRGPRRLVHPHREIDFFTLKLRTSPPQHPTHPPPQPESQSPPPYCTKSSESASLYFHHPSRVQDPPPSLAESTTRYPATC